MKMKELRETVVDVLVFIGLAIVYIVEAIVQFFVPVSYKSKSVAGDVVLITGGGGGLGRLLAERFAKLGSIIVVWDINQSGEFSLTQYTLNIFRDDSRHYTAIS